MWKVHFEQEWHTPTKLDYYLAQIAREIRAANVKKGTRVSIEDMFVKFRDTTKKPTAAEQAARAAVSKARWAAFLGIKEE